MNTLTFRCSDAFRTRKTMRWLGWLSFCLLFFMGQIGFAQTITIGTGTTTNGNVPTASCYNYSFSQQIYTAAQIGMPDGGNILKLRFYYNSGGTTYANWDEWTVYVANTTKTSFTTTTDWEPISNFTQVFSGEISVNPSGGWFDIDFSDTFDYTGGNLIIAVHENAPGYSCTPAYRVTTSDANTSMYVRRDGTDYDPSTISTVTATGRLGVVPQLQLVFEASIVPNCAIDLFPLDAATGVVKNPTLTWTDNGGLATNYDVYFGTTANPSFVANVTSTSYEPTAPLDSNTTFYWKIVPKNINGDATGCIEQSFTTGTGLVYCTSVPTSNDNSGITNVVLGSSSFPVADVTYYMYPTTIDIQAGTTVASAVTFATGYDYDTNIWIDLNDDGVFDSSELVFDGMSTNANPTTLDTSFYLDVLASLGEHRMRIGTADSGQATPNPCYSGSFGVTIDITVNVTEAPSCFPPTDLTASNLTFNSADLGWVSDGEQFDVLWGASGFDVEEEGTLEEGFENGGTLSGLTAETNYQFYVRNNCGGDLSPWTGPVSFTTPCAPATTGFSQDFDSGSTGTSSNPNLTDCWSFIDSGAGYGYVYNFSSPNTTPNHFYIYNSSDNAGDYILVSPPTDNLGNGEYWVKFYAKSGAANYSLQFGTLSDGTDASTFTVLETITLTTTYQEYIIALPAGTDDYFGFRHGLGDIYRSVYIDNIVYEEMPSCFPPTDLTAVPTSLTGADISWTASEPVPTEGYEYAVTTSPTAPESGTSVMGTSASVSGLATDTTHYLHVRANCGEGDYSDWATTSFWLGYCTPVYTDGKIYGDLISNVVISGTTLANNTGTAEVNPAYTYFAPGVPSQTATLMAGSSYDVTVTVGTFGSQNVAVWIDFNNNGVFEASEKIGYTTSTIGANGSATFPITLPCDPVPGDYRMRVRDVYGSNPGSTMDPCASYGYGETEDYTVTIAPPPPCPAPSAGVASTITDEGATLDWTAGCEEVLWDVHVGLAGSGEPTGEPSDPSVTQEFAKTGLEANTAYEFWVRADCDTNGTSDWVGPFEFSTMVSCVTPDAPSAITFSSVTATTTTVSYTAPVELPTGYIIIRSTATVPPVLENGTVYTVNNTTANASLSEENDYFVVYNSTETSASITSGLTANTQYYYYVYSRYGTATTSCYGGPVYSVTPLTGTATTSSAAPTAFTSDNITFTTADVSWTAPAAGGEAGTYTYFVEVATDSGFTNQIAGSPFEAGTTPSYSLSDLTQGTFYYVRVRTFNGFSYSPYLTGNITTLLPGQVGTGISAQSTLPIVSSYGYNYSQQIYTKVQVEENLEEGQNFITKIKFYYNGVSGSGAVPGSSTTTTSFQDWTVYLGNTDKASFSSNTDWIALGEMEQSFSGTVTFPAPGNWMEIILDEPFQWDNESNIVVAVDENSASFGTSVYWRSFTSESNRGIYYRNDSTNPNPASPPTATGRTATLAQIAFEAIETPDCLPVTGLAAGNETPYTVDLSWVGTEEQYEVAYGAFGFNPENEGTIVSEITENPYTLSGLAAETTYQFYVRQYCGENPSPWAGPVAFTTAIACYPVTDLTAEDITFNSADLSWTSEGEQFDIKWGEQGFDFETEGTLVSEISNPYTLEGLAPVTDYSYYVRQNCTGTDDGTSTWVGPFSFTTECLPPSITGTTGDTLCGQGEATLTATADEGATIAWYADETGGTKLAEGGSFTTPLITETTSYWVAAFTGTNGNGARLAPASTPSTTASNYGLIFTAIESFVLNTVDVYLAGAAGNIVVNLTNTSGTVLQTQTIALPAGNATTPVLHTITLDFDIEPGDYRLIAQSGPSMVRESSVGGFPYAVGDVATVTNGYLSGNSTTYYYFYNWAYTAGCHSPRTEVIATVTNSPDFALSGVADTICEGESTNTVTITTGAEDYDTYVWEPATGVTGNETTGWTFNPSETTVYTLTVSQSEGVCATSAEFTVTVNALPVIGGIIPNVAEICVGEQVEFTIGNPPVIPVAYCIPTVASSDGSDLINNFSFATITNNNSGQSTAQYGDFTAMSANVIAGQDYTISMQSGSGSSQLFKVWIDYDQSGTFDASEVVFFTSTTSTAVQSGSFTISSTALNGTTRMRVGSKYSTILTNTQACNNPGYGEYEDYTLIISGGVTPPTYSWSDGTSEVGTTASLTVTPTVTTTYTLTATAAGCSVSESVTVTVNAIPVAPSGDASQSVAAGTTLADLVVTGDNLTWYADEALTTVLPDTTVAEHEATYFVTQTTGTCQSEALAVTVCVAGSWIGTTSSDWNDASNWCGGVPNSASAVVIRTAANNPVVTTGVSVASVEVENGAELTVASNASLTTGNITVANGGSFVIENDANLFQTAGVVNTGDVTVKRNSSLIKHLDYTIWSSPVAGQGLKAFSPETMWYRIYTYNTSTDEWNQVFGTAGTPDTNFTAGTGYMFRAPNNFITTPYTYNGEFTGTPNNENVTVNFGANDGEYQSIGNPYPSNIRIEGTDGFWDENPGTGTLYFWTNVHAWNGSAYAGNNWATFSKVGGTEAIDGDGTPTSSGGNSSQTPNGIIPVGQGFVVQSGALNSVTFTNAMRTADTGVFLKMLDADKGRLWLNLSEGNQALNQILIGYVSGATQGYDFGYDAEMFGYAGSALYSLIGNDGVDYTIQGRALPFDDNDEVPLGFIANNGGSFTISLSNFDGLFIDENQDIFLKDNLTGEEHNLKNDAYTFVSEQGTFNNRFSIVYKEAGSLNVSTPDLNNNWVVYKQNDVFQIQTQGFDMKAVMVYDMLGRVVYTAQAEGNNHTVSRIEANQVLVVKITTADNQVLTKKINN